MCATPRQMTTIVRNMACESEFDLLYTTHAKERMFERDLITADVMYILKNGNIYEQPEDSTRPGFPKYKMKSTTPNSENREVQIIIIPDQQDCCVKIVTIMWVDSH